MGDNEPHTNGVNGGGESDDEVNICTCIMAAMVSVMCTIKSCSSFLLLISEAILRTSQTLAQRSSTGASANVKESEVVPKNVRNAKAMKNRLSHLYNQLMTTAEALLAFVCPFVRLQLTSEVQTLTSSISSRW